MFPGQSRVQSVEQRDLGHAAIAKVVECVDGFFETVADHAPATELMGEDAAVGFVIVDDQSVSVGEIYLRVLRRGQRRLAFGRRRCRSVDGESETRSTFRGVAEIDFAAEQLHKPSANGETEAGATVFSRRGRIDLAKWFEQASDTIGGNS